MADEQSKRVVGYARVSTAEQNTSAQIEAFRRAGITDIFEEKQSAVKERPELEKLLRNLRRGDVLVVYKLDRLARSVSHFVRVFEDLQRRGIGFRSLTQSIETDTPHGRMFVHMLSAFAEFEREMILERCAAGIEAARQRGVKFGRERSLPESQEAQLVRMYRSGNYSMSDLGRHFGIHVSSVKRAIYRVTKPGHSSLA